MTNKTELMGSSLERRRAQNHRVLSSMPSAVGYLECMSKEVFLFKKFVLCYYTALKIAVTKHWAQKGKR